MLLYPIQNLYSNLSDWFWELINEHGTNISNTHERLEKRINSVLINSVFGFCSSVLAKSSTYFIKTVLKLATRKLSTRP